MSVLLRLVGLVIAGVTVVEALRNQDAGSYLTWQYLALGVESGGLLFAAGAVLDHLADIAALLRGDRSAPPPEPPMPPDARPWDPRLGPPPG